MRKFLVALVILGSWSGIYACDAGGVACSTDAQCCSAYCDRYTSLCSFIPTKNQFDGNLLWQDSIMSRTVTLVNAYSSPSGPASFAFIRKTEGTTPVFAIWDGTKKYYEFYTAYTNPAYAYGFRMYAGNGTPNYYTGIGSSWNQTGTNNFIFPPTDLNASDVGKVLYISNYDAGYDTLTISTGTVGGSALGGIGSCGTESDGASGYFRPDGNWNASGGITYSQTCSSIGAYDNNGDGTLDYSLIGGHSKSKPLLVWAGSSNWIGYRSTNGKILKILDNYGSRTTNQDWTLPPTPPVSGQFLYANSVSGTDPYAITLGWTSTAPGGGVSCAGCTTDVIPEFDGANLRDSVIKHADVNADGTVDVAIDPKGDSVWDYRFVGDPDGTCVDGEVLKQRTSYGGITCRPMNEGTTNCVPVITADGGTDTGPSRLCTIDTNSDGTADTLSLLTGNAFIPQTDLGSTLGNVDYRWSTVFTEKISSGLDSDTGPGRDLVLYTYDVDADATASLTFNGGFNHGSTATIEGSNVGEITLGTGGYRGKYSYPTSDNTADYTLGSSSLRWYQTYTTRVSSRNSDLLFYTGDGTSTDTERLKIATGSGNRSITISNADKLTFTSNNTVSIGDATHRANEVYAGGILADTGQFSSADSLYLGGTVFSNPTPGNITMADSGTFVVSTFVDYPSYPQRAELKVESGDGFLTPAQVHVPFRVVWHDTAASSGGFGGSTHTQSLEFNSTVGGSDLSFTLPNAAGTLLTTGSSATITGAWVFPYIGINADGDGTYGQLRQDDTANHVFWDADRDATQDATEYNLDAYLLDNLGNPSANKSFTMANKQLAFTWTTPNTADGALDLEATGAYSGDLVHIHQHTGNPGTTDLLHIEAADADVTPIAVTGASTYGITSNRPINVSVATGTAPFVVASTTEVANLKSADSTKFDGIGKGTMSNGKSCTYNSTGPVIDCNTTAGGGSPCDAWPVGSIFISVSSTNPGTSLGCGTWTAFGAGRVLVGLDSGDTDFDTSEETGGAKTVASSAQTFTGTASTVIVNHTHDVNVGSANDTSTVTGAGNYFSGTSNTVVATTGNPKSGGAANYTPAGTNAAGAATSVVQPYIVVYMFKRTA